MAWFMQCHFLMKKKVAIPRLKESISPCFEASSCIEMVVISDNKVESRQQVICPDTEGHKKLRLLKVHRVDVLICNGIKDLYQNMLNASGVVVIKKISNTIDKAIELYLAGELLPEAIIKDEINHTECVPHSELVDWATRIFIENGYNILTPSKNDQLIDLIAEIKCPVCSKTVRVAICCGSHTYRPSQEITEFHHATPSGYNAKIYVCPGNQSIEECCHQYGIELLDPNLESETENRHKDKLPLLKGPVLDHKKASFSE